MSSFLNAPLIVNTPDKKATAEYNYWENTFWTLSDISHIVALNKLF